MLVLMRRKDEGVKLEFERFGEKIEISLGVKKITGTQVILGIEAQKDIKIIRTELPVESKIEELAIV